jgi:uncharacterized damage-inducible protein DinB
MNYYGAKELANSFRTVRNNTITIAEEIGEEHYGFSPAPGTRTVAQLLVHISMVSNFQEQLHSAKGPNPFQGFDFMSHMKRLAVEETAPRTKAQIVALLRENGDRFARFLDGFSDEFLGESLNMPPGGTPPSRTRFDMLMSVKEHEMHHRGQLMLIERMIGIVPHLTRANQARMAAMSAAPQPA